MTRPPPNSPPFPYPTLFRPRVQAGCKWANQPPPPPAPRGGPAHPRLCPIVHRTAEELRPVEQGLDDVGHATPAHQADEHELQPLGQAVTMLDCAETHQRPSPRSAASPRSSRPRAAPSAAETVTSQRASSELPARSSAPRSSSVTV